MCMIHITVVKKVFLGLHRRQTLIKSPHVEQYVNIEKESFLCPFCSPYLLPSIFISWKWFSLFDVLSNKRFFNDEMKPSRELFICVLIFLRIRILIVCTKMLYVIWMYTVDIVFSNDLCRILDIKRVELRCVRHASW